HRDDRQRHAGRPRGLSRSGHGRLRQQTDPARRARRRVSQGTDRPARQLEPALGGIAAPGGTVTEAVDHRTLAALSQATGDDPAFLAELIDTYLADAPGLLMVMRDALAAREAAGLRRAAHTLKSTSATLGAHRLPPPRRGGGPPPTLRPPGARWGAHGPADLRRRRDQAEGPAETLVAQAGDEYL